MGKHVIKRTRKIAPHVYTYRDLDDRPTKPLRSIRDCYLMAARVTEECYRGARPTTEGPPFKAALMRLARIMEAERKLGALATSPVKGSFKEDIGLRQGDWVQRTVRTRRGTDRDGRPLTEVSRTAEGGKRPPGAGRPKQRLKEHEWQPVALSRHLHGALNSFKKGRLALSKIIQEAYTAKRPVRDLTPLSTIIEGAQEMLIAHKLAEEGFGALPLEGEFNELELDEMGNFVEKTVTETHGQDRYGEEQVTRTTTEKDGVQQLLEGEVEELQSEPDLEVEKGEDAF